MNLGAGIFSTAEVGRFRKVIALITENNFLPDIIYENKKLTVGVPR